MAEYESRKGETEEKTIRRNKPLDSAREKLKAGDGTREHKTAGSPSLEGHASLLSDTRLSHPASAGPMADIVSGLQRDYGNAYVQRLLRSAGAQAKLTVSSPDDQHEKEADRVAEAVAQAPQAQIQRQEAGEQEEEAAPKLEVSRQVEEEGGEEEAEEEAAPKLEVRRQEEGIDRAPEVSEEMETRITAEKGGGEPLADSARASMEPHFGRDFSEVRVHTGAEADSLSQQLGARAFTTGSDIFFREGAYQPGSESGQKLLGHEMTHVVQQGGAPVARKAVEAEEKSAPTDKKQAETELKKARNRAVSDMTKANIRELLLQAAHCQQIGVEEPVKDVLDQAVNQALGALKKKTQSFNVVTSSRRMARELLDQIAKVQLLGAEGAGKTAEKALEKLLQWAQAQLAGAIKALQTAPSEGTARDVLEKAALVQMLGGDTTAASAAVQAWQETEKS